MTHYQQAISRTMSRIILPIGMIVVAVVVFVVFVVPRYDSIKAIRAEDGEYNKALSNARELQAVRDQLLSQYNTMDESNRERLEKLLPENIDNVKLILELDVLATKHGMALRDVQIRESGDETDALVATPIPEEETKEYGVTGLQLSLEGDYDNFISFLENVERSLRIIDIESVSFASQSNTLATNRYQYEVDLTTYWLR